ncbi:Protein ASPARTIC PROTEASE IN GUARD CELL 1 [Linum grandiflorum]
MAAAPPPFLFLPIFFTLLTPTFSRSIPPPPNTHTTFDVAASLNQALRFLSPQPQTHPHKEEEEEASLITQSSFDSSSNSFSLDLLSRESVISSNYLDYKSLILSRLRRDSDRVQSLSSKLPLSPNLSTPITSGSKQRSQEYFSRVRVGTPPRSFYMVLDTGSDVKDHIFNPSSSSSYSPLTCASALCSSLDPHSCRSPNHCLYEVNYGDDSNSTGDFVTETLSFGSPYRSFPKIALGCGHDNQGYFVGAAGLLGLGGGALSLTSQLKATSFSYCLVNRDSPASLMRDKFMTLALDLRTASPVDMFDTCYNLSGMSTVRVPTVAFHFAGGKTWDLPPANYLIPVDGHGTFCFAFAPATSPLSIIGNVQQQGTRVSFDLVNKRVGFSTNKC